MRIHRDLHDFPPTARGGAVAIGNFDGVHLGHAALVRRLVERAGACGGPAVVFTFDPHPVRLLRPAESPPPLTWTERKAELLACLGVEHVVAYPTDEALLRLSAREFFNLVIRDALGARALVEGPNFYFGHGREGDIRMLGEFAAGDGVTLDVVEPVEIAGEMVSSSRVRRLLLEAGDAAGAASLLSAPYRVRGIVTHGAGRGAKLGFPTANLEGIDTIVPAHGVYAGVAHAAVGRFPQRWAAAVNVGPNPTFGDGATKVEAHLLGCDESLYGRQLEIDFLARLRDVRRFASPAELAAGVREDIAATQRIAADAVHREQPAP